MADITITLRLFGAFRKYGESVVFAMPAGCTALAVKQKIPDVLAQADRALIRDSALASDDEIVDPAAVLTADCRLAILPPVCGG